MIKIRKATVNDVGGIFILANKCAARGLMLPRSKYKIVSMLQGFIVAEDTATAAVVGCGAFDLLWTDLGEIMTLAVEEAYQRQGVGRQLVAALVAEAVKMQVPEILVLTYQVDFFAKLGFKATNKDQFPRKLWRECLECPKLEECDETVMHMKIDAGEPAVNNIISSA